MNRRLYYKVQSSERCGSFGTMNLSLALALSCFCFSPIIVSELTCPDSSWVVVNELDEGGIAVLVRENSTTEHTRIIRNHSLPGECGPNHRLCNLIILRDSYLVIPAVRSLIILPLLSNSSMPQVITDHLSDCNPTNSHFFVDDGFDLLWVACVQSRDVSSLLTYVGFFLPAEETLTLQPFRSSLQPLEGTEFSESLLISDVHGDKSLYVVVDGEVYNHPVSRGTSPQFMVNGVSLQNCSSVLYVDHLRGSEVFTIHCSNGTIISYDSSSEHPASYHNPAVSGIPFSSFPGMNSRFPLVYWPESVTVRSSDGTILSQLNHTLGEIRFGEFHSGTLGVIRADSSFYVVRVITEEVVEIVGSVCDVEGNGLCVLPSYSFDGSQLLVYDFTRASLSVVFLLEQCVAVDTIPLSSSSISTQRPSLMIFFSSASTGSHPCECVVTDSLPTPSSTTESTSDVTPDLSTSTGMPASSQLPTKNTVSISTPNSSTAASVSTSSPSIEPPMLDQSHQTTIVATSVVLSVVIIPLILTPLLFLVILRAKKHGACLFKKDTESTSGIMEHGSMELNRNGISDSKENGGQVVKEGEGSQNGGEVPDIQLQLGEEDPQAQGEELQIVKPLMQEEEEPQMQEEEEEELQVVKLLTQEEESQAVKPQMIHGEESQAMQMGEEPLATYEESQIQHSTECSEPNPVHLPLASNSSHPSSHAHPQPFNPSVGYSNPISHGDSLEGPAGDGLDVPTPVEASTSGSGSHMVGNNLLLQPTDFPAQQVKETHDSRLSNEDKRNDMNQKRNLF